MWTSNSSGKRRPANRLHARHAKRQAEWRQLDVKMRPRRSKRPLRRHRSVWGLRIAAIAVTLISLSAGGRWIYRQSVTENAEFKLQQLLVFSDGALSPLALAEVTGVKTGVNILTLDLNAIQKSLEALPLVESATVERVFPADLEIRVKERKPVAWLACPAEGIHPHMAEGGALLSSEAKILRCDRLIPQFEQLPIIEVLEMPDPNGVRGPDPRQIKAALEVLGLSGERFAATGLELLEIKLQQPYSLRCIYNQDLQVTFGLLELDRQLQDLEWILGGAAVEGRKLSTVNTMMSRNIPVTFHDSGVPVSESVEHPHLRPLRAKPSSVDRLNGSAASTDLRTILRRG